MTTQTAMKSRSPKILAFFEEYPEIRQYIEEQQAKGPFPGEFTPTVVEVKFLGLTYIRYESGKITASRECGKGFVPDFWEVCFDEEESALFVLTPSEVLLDRTGEMTEIDTILKDCNLLVAS